LPTGGWLALHAASGVERGRSTRSLDVIMTRRAKLKRRMWLGLGILSAGVAVFFSYKLPSDPLARNILFWGGTIAIICGWLFTYLGIKCPVCHGNLRGIVNPFPSRMLKYELKVCPYCEASMMEQAK
jgi:hypothetical protein